ncbi:MAG: phosphoribosylglycinamide formyltransferase [Patescibacteria group bacterium]
MSKLRVAILASTNATSSQQLIIETQAGKIPAEVVCFISNKADSGALARAGQNNIEAIFINGTGKSREEFDRELIRVLAEKKIDLVLLIGYMRFLSKSFVDAWGNKTMNIHPSLLPAFAGGMDKNVHEEVLKAGVKKTGCTLHFITEQADAGPIILQQEVDVASDETVESLKNKVQAAEQDVICRAVRLFAEGKINVVDGQVVIK